MTAGVTPARRSPRRWGRHYQGILASASATARQQRAEDVWEEKYPEITILAARPADYDAAKARSVMQDFVQSIGDKRSAALEQTEAFRNIQRSDKTWHQYDGEIDKRLFADITHGTCPMHHIANRHRHGPAQDGVEAEMTYGRAGESLIIIDHTEVPAALRGRKVGERLVGQAIEDARRDGAAIIALCPFAKAQIGRHPEWQDVVRQ